MTYISFSKMFYLIGILKYTMKLNCTKKFFQQKVTKNTQKVLENTTSSFNSALWRNKDLKGLEGLINSEWRKIGFCFITSNNLCFIPHFYTAWKFLFSFFTQTFLIERDLKLPKSVIGNVRKKINFSQYNISNKEIFLQWEVLSN